jgi:CHAT domain-containing protein
MSADLVVLSACRSGVGEAVRGEGVVGLTRAFLYAGSRGVVVSLWNVGDQSTGDLMLEFYRGIRAGDSPSRSLRNAKLGFLASDRPARRRPWAWAPFVLVGVPGEPGIGMNPVAAAPTE